MGGATSRGHNTTNRATPEKQGRVCERSVNGGEQSKVQRRRTVSTDIHVSKKNYFQPKIPLK
jgi:hypothetical protein